MTASRLRARYRRIVWFFARVTAGFIFWEIVLPRLGLRAWSRRTRTERNRRTAARFRVLATRMGGLMIKVGQFLSSRLDVLPPEITAELAALQDEVPSESFVAIRTLAEAELGSSLENHYEWFDEQPLAAASLGQAHRARLCERDAAVAGFTDVVVKVQRPDIDKIVEVDLAALRRVGGWLQRYEPVSKRANVPALVEEFAATTREEIDYLAEASNAEAFADAFAETPHVHVPDVIWELTTRRVITLEDVTAIKLTDNDAIDAAGISRAKVARVLVDTYLTQIFDNGFFHADPHPGNLFVTPVGDVDDEGERDWKLTFIDFGMVGHVPENLREGFREALVAVALQDGARLVRSFKKLDVLLPSADLERIEAASSALFDRFGGMSMGDLRDIDHAEMAQFGMQFSELIFELPFQLPENLLLLGRTIAILSGMCTSLDPEFNLWVALTPYATRFVGEGDEEGFTIGGISIGSLLEEGSKILQTAVGLPARADRVLRQIERGDLSVRTPMLDIRIRRLERRVSRLAYVLIFSAMLIAGAILYAADPVLGKWLMGLSVLPLAAGLLGGSGRHGR